MSRLSPQEMEKAVNLANNWLGAPQTQDTIGLLALAVLDLSVPASSSPSPDDLTKRKAAALDWYVENACAIRFDGDGPWVVWYGENGDERAYGVIALEAMEAAMSRPTETEKK